jgi:hypothetical protein
MRKSILWSLVALSLIGAGIFQGVPALADEVTSLDHVRITTVNATMVTGATQQLIAQGYDAGEVAISGINYYWTVNAGGGTINATGLFTAAGVPGTYNDTVKVIALQGNTVRLASATVTVTSTVGVLDHVQVTPAAATIVPGGTRQFVAQGYDAANVAIANLTYAWSVVGGGGSINSTGLFTAGTTTGTFANTVLAGATQNSITRNGTASVTIVDSSNFASQTYIQNLGRLFSGFFKNIGFNKIMGGQLQVKNGTGVDTIKAVPGVVQAISSNSLVFLPNGQIVNSTFTLESNTVILPEGTPLALNDRIIVVTVNDRVSMVVKITATSASEPMPPGLKKQEDDRREGKKTPLGWSRGNKTGWRKNSTKNEGESESD